jgi:hypothetical protein
MTTITIEQSLLEQALNALLLPCDRWNKQQFLIVKGAIESLNAALVAPAAAPEQPASKALQDVATERQRQDAKWGGPEHDDTHPISDWQRFISQRAENLVYRGNPERMYELFIEIAALAVAAAESIDRKGTP